MAAVMIYDRAALVDTLVYHQRRDIRYCTCGWDALGKSHPEHVANVYEQVASLRGVGLHSRACGIHVHEHGPACHPNCPTCGGAK
jgi:hypothetical protein